MLQGIKEKSAHQFTDPTRVLQHIRDAYNSIRDRDGSGDKGRVDFSLAIGRLVHLPVAGLEEWRRIQIEIQIAPGPSSRLCRLFPLLFLLSPALHGMRVCVPASVRVLVQKGWRGVEKLVG